MDPSEETSNDLPESAASRVERLQEHRRGRRLWVVLAIVLSLALFGGVIGGVFYLLDRTESLPPSRVVLVSEAKLEDDTTAAGLICVVSRHAGQFDVRGVDSGKRVSIPGTSYDRLADALPLGGGELVAKLLYPNDDKAAWIVLTPEAAARLLDANGGVQIDIPGATTVFTGEELFRFKAGSGKLAGAEAVALGLGADVFGAEQAAQVRMSLSEALGTAAERKPDVLLDLIDSGLAESSANERALSAYFGR